MGRLAAYVTEVVYGGILYVFWLVPARTGDFEYWYLLVSVPPEEPSIDGSLELLRGLLNHFRIRITPDLWKGKEGETYAWFTLRSAKRNVNTGIKAVIRDHGPKFRKRWGFLEWDREWHRMEE